MKTNATTKKPMTHWGHHFWIAIAAVAVSLSPGCKPKDSGTGSDGAAKTILQVRGSDTMVNVAQVWAEEYKKTHPNIEVEVSGGGSGVGIAALVKGTIDIADASRNMKPGEIEDAKKNTGKTPKEIIVGFDALAIYVNKDNPIEEISADQLAAIFGEGGDITRWSQIGVKLPEGNDEIIRVSRQSSSGTYEFFREHILNKHDYKQGSRDMNGSKEVVELVGSTLGAIGYSGMGYNDPTKVKMLKVSPKTGEPAVAPSVANTLDKSYPIARSLQVYTLGEPQGEVKNYIDWILSPPGQAIVEKQGYVPLPSAPAKP